MKRFRLPSAKPGELKVAFGKEPHYNPDLFYCHGGDGATSQDGQMLGLFFERTDGLWDRTLRKELEARGYDITTLKFTIKKKPPIDG